MFCPCFLILLVSIACVSATTDCSTQLSCSSCTRSSSCQWCATSSGSGKCVAQQARCLSGCKVSSCAIPACIGASCELCTRQPGCGWCNTLQRCTFVQPRSSQPCWSSCSPFYISPSQCDSCQTFTSCSTCTNSSSTNCSWCPNTGVCAATGTLQCSRCPAISPLQCGGDLCSKYGKNCTACVTDPTCGYCSASSSCMSQTCRKYCIGDWNSNTCNAECSKFGNDCSSCIEAQSASCGFCYNTATFVTSCVPLVNGTAPPSTNCVELISPSLSCPCSNVNCSDCINSTASVGNATVTCGWCSSTVSSFCAINASQEVSSCAASRGLWSTDTCSPVTCAAGCEPPRGSCNDITGLCSCAEGWLGPSCNCSQNVLICNYGICNATTGQCACNESYYGTSCSLFCDARISCSGNGVCSSTGRCECNSNYYGPTCSTFCDANASCSGNGVCSVSGTCICNSFFSGTNCSHFSSDGYCASMLNCSSCSSASITSCGWCEEKLSCLTSTNTTANCSLALACDHLCSSLPVEMCLRANDSNVNTTVTPGRCSCLWCNNTSISNRPMCILRSLSFEMCSSGATEETRCEKALNLFKVLAIGGGAISLIIIVSVLIIFFCKQSQNGYQRVL